MFVLLKKWYLKRLAAKITIAYLSNPNTYPSDPLNGINYQIKEINQYVLNVLMLGSKGRKKYLTQIFELDKESENIQA